MAEWTPGNGGLILHTILIDPDNPARMWAGVSAGGLYRTEDQGATWTPLKGAEQAGLESPVPPGADVQVVARSRLARGPGDGVPGVPSGQGIDVVRHPFAHPGLCHADESGVGPELPERRRAAITHA